jgi:hypothetical protein
LVFQKCRYPPISLPGALVPLDKSTRGQRVEHARKVDLVVGKAVRLEFLGSPLEPAFPVSDREQAGKRQSEWETGLFLGPVQVVMLEKFRLDGSDSWAQNTTSNSQEKLDGSLDFPIPNPLPPTLIPPAHPVMLRVGHPDTLTAVAADEDAGSRPQGAEEAADEHAAHK